MLSVATLLQLILWITKIPILQYNYTYHWRGSVILGTEAIDDCDNEAVFRNVTPIRSVNKYPYSEHEGSGFPETFVIIYQSTHGATLGKTLFYISVIDIGGGEAARTSKWPLNSI